MWLADMPKGIGSLAPRSRLPGCLRLSIWYLREFLLSEVPLGAVSYDQGAPVGEGLGSVFAAFPLKVAGGGEAEARVVALVR